MPKYVLIKKVLKGDIGIIVEVTAKNYIEARKKVEEGKGKTKRVNLTKGIYGGYGGYTPLRKRKKK